MFVIIGILIIVVDLMLWGWGGDFYNINVFLWLLGLFEIILVIM